MAKILTIIALVALLNLCLTMEARAQAVAVTVGSTTTVLTPSQRSNAGLSIYYPDSSLTGFQQGGTNYIFGADGDANDTQGLTSVDLNNLQTNLIPIDTATNIPKGGSNDFDFNYAGGGIVYYDATTGILLNMYHGENWYGGDGSPFYGALGLAYSTDMGVTWHKLGEVISPQTARNNMCQVDVGAGSLIARPDGYFYAFYDDEGAGCNGSNYNVAVARAKITDVIAAAQAGTPFTSGPGTLFQKYYNGGYTQNGVTDLANPQNGGGNFTPLFAGNSAWWPNVAWDSSLSEYVMVYAAAWNGIAMRFSPDGINWSGATQIVSGGSAPPNAIFYPSLLNTSGGDPETLGNSFYVYYVDPFGDWSQSNLMRVQVAVSGSAPAPPVITGISVD